MVHVYLFVTSPGFIYKTQYDPEVAGSNINAVSKYKNSIAC